MLQKIREKTTGWIATLIVGLLIIPFAFFGVNNYFSERAQLWVAKVGEQEISQDYFRQRFEEYRRQMRQMMGESYDPSILETPEARRRVLDGLVEESLLRQYAKAIGMAVSPRQLQEEIMKIDAFKLDGKFNAQQYRTLLASQGMSPLSFEQRIRDELEVRMLPQGLGRSAFATVAELDHYLRLRDQTRDFRHLELPAPAAEEVGEPDAEALAAYHAAHADRYLSEETVRIEYVMVGPDQMGEAAQSVDEETLRKRYEEQKMRFTEVEQRLASHILIRLPADAPAEQQKEAQARARALAEQARSEGADFAALARENSEDAGSKAAGGDLGWIEPGLTDPAFESALFAMQPGEISEPVRSAEGWHVIWLREVRPGKVKPFEEVRGQIESEYLASERERALNERAGRLVDIVYRDPSTLAAASKELGLEVHEAGPFGRAGGEDPVTRDPKVLKAAFDAQHIRDGTASDPIDLGDGRILVLRVVEHRPSKPLTLEEVRDQVQDDWRRDRLRELADRQAAEWMARWEKGASLDDLAAEAGVEVHEAKGVRRSGIAPDPALIREAFRLARPGEGEVRRAVVELAPDRRALLELDRVSDGDPAAVPAAERQAVADQLAQSLAAVEVRELIERLRERYPVTIAENRLQ